MRSSADRRRGTKDAVLALMRYVIQRVAMAFVVVYVVISMSFFMIRLMPGSPMLALQEQLQLQGGLTFQEIQAKVNAIYALQPHNPLWQQYFTYVGHAFQGDLGQSISSPGTTVLSIIAGSLPWTIFAVSLSLIISFVIGIAVGSFMAALQERRSIKVVTLFVSFAGAIPNYLVAIVLLYFFVDVHHIFPLGGAYSANDTVGFNLAFIESALRHAVLPVAAYVLTSFGGWALAMKGSATSALGSEYVRAAESWGLSRRRVTQSYVGRNSMLPMVTSLALSIGFMFGGSVFIETYFTYPGIGYYLIQSVNNRDYSLMMGCFLLITISVVVSNMLVDLLYPLVDPRIKSPGALRRVKASTAIANPSVADVPPPEPAL
ncbi:MAG: ABC transporter permease [Acidimicrobiales bacterium]